MQVLDPPERGFVVSPRLDAFGKALQRGIAESEDASEKQAIRAFVELMNRVKENRGQVRGGMRMGTGMGMGMHKRMMPSARIHRARR